MDYRKEKDLLGEKEIPADAYWGIYTARALENFPLSGRKVNDGFIRAYAAVKSACCQANFELGYLEKKPAEAILQACDEIREGKFSDQFPVDSFQGGAGTSTNMNLNEVIANRAIEMLGGKKGEYSLVHPLEQVNLHQSTNDTYPTALKIAAIYKFRQLSTDIAELQGVFQEKEKEFSAIVKIGRTELQEAVPMTLGAEFSAFAEALTRDRWRTFKCEERLRTVNIGGTAVGTGICAPRAYIFLVIEKLRALTGLGLCRGENVIDQTANTDMFVEVSGIAKAHAAVVMKIARDLRLLHLLGEIVLPPLQAGSSIMPGKINPVLCEAALQAGLQVQAYDAMLFQAVSSSHLQINEFMPLVALALLDSLDLLINLNRRFVPFIRGITADAERCAEYLCRSHGLITAFVPVVGYEKATDLIGEFCRSGEKDLSAFLRNKLGDEVVNRVLTPQRLMSLGYAEENNRAIDNRKSKDSPERDRTIENRELKDNPGK